MRQEVRQRMNDRKLLRSIRLLYAGILASLGDEEGQKFLLDQARQDDDAEQTKELFWLFGHFIAMGNVGDLNRKEVNMLWAEDFMLKMLKEPKTLKIIDRPGQITHADKSVSRQTLALNSSFGNFASILAKLQNEELCSVLINLYEQQDILKIYYCNREILWAMGELKNERAIPLLLKVLKEHKNDDYRYAASALAQMKCHAAIPILFKYLDDYNTYDCLSEYDSPAILPALKNALPDIQEAKAKLKARFLVIKLQDQDKLPQLIALMSDPQIQTAAMEDKIIDEIARLKDKRSIPFFQSLLHNSTNRFIIQDTINILGTFHDHLAIKALIEGLKIDFNKKVERSKDTSDKNKRFKQAIADVLSQNTGKNFGINAKAWLKWYNETYLPEEKAILR